MIRCAEGWVDVRFAAHNGLKSDIGPCPVRADSVEKVLFG
jgi:hypothetical protein